MIAGVAIGLLGGGAALAATQIDSPSQESQAVVSDAAKQLGVQPSALSGALKKALMDRVDAAVAAGRITKAQGDAIKQRIESGDYPLFGFGGPGGLGGLRGHFGGPGPGRFGQLSAAASYLGLTPAALASDLVGGKSLAQVAKDQGKSVDGLVSAMVASAQKTLDAAVSAGRITKSQEQAALANLKQRITALVNGKRPSFKGTHSFRGFRHFGFDGQPTKPPVQQQTKPSPWF